MGIFFVYLLKAATILAIFFLLNKLLLDKETFHGLNRVIWLLLIPISYILPNIGLDLFIQSVPDIFPVAPTDAIPQILVTKDVIVTFDNFIKGLFVAWLTGSVVLFIRLIVNYYKLFGYIRSKKCHHPDLVDECKRVTGFRGKVSLLLVDYQIIPFSWMNFIVVSQKDFSENGKEIIIHELTHIRLGHSWDLLVADLNIIVQWFNPASWLLKRSIQQVHEFQADNAVVKSGVDTKKYQLLLIEKAVGKRLYSMANSFNHSKLKKRITMMLKEKSSKWAYAKCFYALPLAFIAVTAFAFPSVSSKMSELSDVKFTSFIGSGQTDGEISVMQTDKLPLFMLDGKEIPGFEGIDPETIESINVLKGETATEKYGMRGINGVVEITSKQDLSETDTSHENVSIRVVGYGNNNQREGVPMTDTIRIVRANNQNVISFDIEIPPSFATGDPTLESFKGLYIVDGIEVETISDIPAEEIESVSVLQGESAINLYGNKAKDGVIILTLKK